LGSQLFVKCSCYLAWNDNEITVASVNLCV
jgi:hypothetical protein